MPGTNELFFSIVFFASMMGFVVAGILFFVNKNASLAPKLLAAYVLLFSIAILHTGLWFTSFYQHYPHFWRSMAWTTFSAPVVAYLYVRSVLYQSFRLKKTDWLLFLPTILYSLLLLPYYLKSTPEKLLVISQLMVDKSLIAKEPEGMLPLGWGVIIRCIFGLTFLFGQYVMLYKMKRHIFQKEQTSQQNRTIFHWLFLFTSILFCFYTILTAEHVFHLNTRINLSTVISFTMTGTIFFISLYLLIKPNILYGLQGWLHPEKQTKGSLEPISYTPVEAEERKPYLTNEQGIHYKKKLENHFDEEKPFLKSGYKISDLSAEIDIPIYKLSAFINQEYGRNFSDLVNSYRISYAAHLLKSSVVHSQYTFEALAREVGFNSRSNFFIAVKKQTGKSPSEFFGTIDAPLVN